MTVRVSQKTWNVPICADCWIATTALMIMMNPQNI